MRLFLAIDLPQEVLFRLDRLISALRPEAFIKWSPLDNLHITTKFIGDWPEGRLGELHDTLQELTPREPFEIELRGLGWFPNERSPRVLWAGVEGGEKLQQLVSDTNERLGALNVERDERPFSPHLTLARLKNPVPLGSLRKKINEMQPAELGSFLVLRFALFRSDPGSNASVYRKLREYSLQSVLAASSAT